MPSSKKSPLPRLPQQEPARDGDRDPPGHAPDQRRPSRPDQPAGMRVDPEEQPAHAERGDERRVHTDRKPQRPGPQPSDREHPPVQTARSSRYPAATARRRDRRRPVETRPGTIRRRATSSTSRAVCRSEALRAVASERSERPEGRSLRTPRSCSRSLVGHDLQVVPPRAPPRAVRACRPLGDRCSPRADAAARPASASARPHRWRSSRQRTNRRRRR